MINFNDKINECARHLLIVLVSKMTLKCPCSYCGLNALDICLSQHIVNIEKFTVIDRSFFLVFQIVFIRRKRPCPARVIAVQNFV